MGVPRGLRRLGRLRAATPATCFRCAEIQSRALDDPEKLDACLFLAEAADNVWSAPAVNTGQAGRPTLRWRTPSSAPAIVYHRRIVPAAVDLVASNGPGWLSAALDRGGPGCV